MTAGAMKFSDLLEALGQALDEERSILLAGNSEQITAIARRKMALAEAIDGHGGGAMPARDEVARLARLNRENSIICAAMLRHLTGALDKLCQRDPHRSYGPDGAEQSPPSQRPLGAA
ncbi:MAG TPA: hypothetical protein VN832_11395 [Stellaceae bacterium]|nr:hypothetical protein [Stellaceae bacterium]